MADEEMYNMPVVVIDACLSVVTAVLPEKTFLL
jgi:hypothetical protein